MDDIIKNLLELYFLRSDGLLCDFETWLDKNKNLEITPQDLIDDEKFERLLDPSKQVSPSQGKSHDDHHTGKEPSVVTKKRDNEKSETILTTNDHQSSPQITSRVVESAKAATTTTDTTSAENQQPQADEGAKSKTSVVTNTNAAAAAAAPELKKSDQSIVSKTPVTRKRTPEHDSTSQPTPIDTISPPPEKKLREESPVKEPIIVEKQDDETTLPIEPKSSPIISPQISRVVDRIVTSNAVSAENQQQQIVERAKHEQAVTSRIAELRKQGLWAAKRLPKLQDPPRPKTHWDYMMEECRWMCADFDTERRWKRKAAKKCALMCYRYHQEKRSKIERAEREHLQHTKKCAASLAREIKSFWTTIEKIVDFRQQTKLEETRQKALGLHLNYILDQTTKFSNTFLEDQAQPPTQAIESDEYLNSQEAEKKPVINTEDQSKSQQDVDDIADKAQSIQPKGNTLETTTVSTKVPFLLKHSLREYQHIGLDWLVAMYNKKLNGILADEMGLGKTIQTIALLAHLACEKGDWGPHLIVVPTSVMLNWEMEIKKWCPAFKILTYYGNPKERRMKRVGWSRPNSFHICITSYRIVIQDHAAFRRKKWCYFILDEAHYIKNFKSQRWQMLLNFNSQRRLLLTGTPLQNDLMELWSLMHFLMPNLFDSYREFKDWFVNPLTGMIEGNQEYNQEQVQRLHKILRPFLLRRLKADVEKQLPRKREFIKTCRLSKRQRYLYEEFMSLSKTKETLATGNFLSVINVLMQLRKVCNHPNLFEPRPTVSPFMMSSLVYKVPGILTTLTDYNPHGQVNLDSLQLLLINQAASLSSTARDCIIAQRPTSDKILEELTDDASSSSDSKTLDGSTIIEIDPTAEAVKTDQVNQAYDHVKELGRSEKESRLNFVARLNQERCSRINAFYFRDIQDRLSFDRLDHLPESNNEQDSFKPGTGRILCSLEQDLRNQPRVKVQYLSSVLEDAVRSPEVVVQSMNEIIKRFVFCVPGVSAPPISMHVSHYSPNKRNQEAILQQTLYENLSPRFDFLNRIMVNMRTSFPELRLIEYDCGKLQTLGRLLNELKTQDHRVLIFTQMSRMLDILEQFLNYHGHTYLRLDGSTKIDQRQILMERFNNDKRIFCFILSTRSGGIGVNLTGADTVIFYDSDWNPTMDAQAQDRCHRIGQTRDVHIYRLISEDTIERNIFMKAQQKRMLGDLAIEEGNFNTSSLRRQAIQDLFNVEPSKGPVEVDKVTEVNGKSEEMNKAQLNKLEQALSKGEADAGEDMDVDAIKVARADVDTDLREFDENIPLTEENSPVEKSEKEQQIDTIVSQMTPIEQYAVKFLEGLQKPRNKEELEQAEREYRQELENKKSQWEQSRTEMLKEQASKDDINETLLTYPRDARCDHVRYMLDGERKVEEMPLWAPPTPPTSPPSPVEESSQYHYQPAMTPAMAARINAMGGLGNIFGYDSDSSKKDMRHFIDEKDLYIDFTTHFLYEPNIMLESQLPPVNQQYTENEATNFTIGSKKIRLTGTPVVPGGYFQTQVQTPHLQQHLQNNIHATGDGTCGLIGQQSVRKPKVRRDEVICLPKSIFDRQTPNFAKVRRELKLQKLRCVTKGNDSDPFAMQKFFHTFSLNPLGQSLSSETIVTTVHKQVQFSNNTSLLLAYNQDQLPPWTIQEEWALLMVIQHLQDIPVNLCLLTPGHTPNWELVSEVVSDVGFTHRSFKMCEYHFAANVQKKEMTRDSSWEERALQSSNQSLDDSQPPTKKSKKNKNQPQTPDGQSSQQSSTSKGISNVPAIPFKPSKTGSALVHDKSLPKSFSERYDIIKRIRITRPNPIRSRYSRERLMNNQPMLVREDKRMIDYDRPQKPEAVILESPVRRPANMAGVGHYMSPYRRQ